MRRLKATKKSEKCKYKRCTYKRVDNSRYCPKHGDNSTRVLSPKILDHMLEDQVKMQKEEQKHFERHFTYHASSAHGRVKEIDPKPSVLDKIRAFIFVDK